MALNVTEMRWNALKIVPNELRVLKILEEILNRDIPSKTRQNRLYFGFFASRGHIIHLNLAASGLTEIPPEIKALGQLTEFFLGTNRLSSLPLEIGALKRLITLDVGQNRLQNLPIEIGGCISLQELYLNHNKIVDLPHTLWSLENLESLDLSHNRLSILLNIFPGLDGHPGGLTYGDRLSSIDISSNQFKIFPEILFRFKKLQVLNGIHNPWDANSIAKFKHLELLRQPDLFVKI